MVFNSPSIPLKVPLIQSSFSATFSLLCQPLILLPSSCLGIVELPLHFASFSSPFYLERFLFYLLFHWMSEQKMSKIWFGLVVAFLASSFVDHYALWADVELPHYQEASLNPH